ncbi:MAG: hypothetical protein ACT4OP_11935 [Actinomycetota bacterium]
MARHICENCGATVIDEEFCPTCGSWIDPLAGDGHRSDDDAEFETFDLEGAPPREEPLRGEPIICPSCGAPNPPGNRHCEECGARLRQGPLPTAPRPAVQSPAGVRAVLAIAGLTLGVVLIALLINLFRDGGGVVSSTTLAAGASTTSLAVQIADPAPIDILVANCTPEGLGGDFSCSNLIDSNEGSFQVNYNELPDGEKSIIIELTFSQPMMVERILWTNLDDQVRFRRNYRAKGITIEAEANPFNLPQELQNAPGEQSFEFAAIRANWIRITVQSVYPAEVVEDQEPFDELAIEGITVIGYPAPDTSTNTTAPSATP